MCLGAIISARINRLVLGGRKSRGRSKYGEYTVEKLIELTNVKDKLTLTTGVLQKKIEEIVNKWIDSK
jgi:tRNA(Arg) A34 adenosine deaminase TadA